MESPCRIQASSSTAAPELLSCITPKCFEVLVPGMYSIKHRKITFLKVSILYDINTAAAAVGRG